ncbi:MAG: sulfite exporter TauE/SafE family protein [Rhodobacteraceae bacterium]|nr:sulfite exporter TauE/SafE family protein [Paracoccaceae bacterium]
MTPFEIAFCAVVFLIAGIAKGTLGIGLPTIAIGLMSQMLDPRLAVTLVLGPLLLTNVQQMLRGGHIARTFLRYAPFWLTLAVTIVPGASFARSLSTQNLLLIMGVSIIVFTLSRLVFTPPPLPVHLRTGGQIVAGAASGLIGGVTAIWGPPIMIYLIAARADKEEFVRATGMLLALGAIPLAAAYAWQGEFRGARAWISLALALPAVLGFLIGERFRARLDPARFRTAVLVMFLIMGANILRLGVA